MSSRRASLVQSVELYPVGDAARFMDQLAERSRVSGTCPATFGGKTFDWDFAPLTLSISGPNVVAWSMESKGLPGQRQVLAFVVRMREEDAISSVIYFVDPFGSLDMAPPNARDFFIGKAEEVATSAQARLHDAHDQLAAN